MINLETIQRKEATHPVMYLACGFIALVILLIDLQVPLGIATGIPYIIVVLLSLKSSENRFTVIAASLCTLLISRP